jgi:asparagine synthase (glutamine-hydrolysing)
LVALAAVICWNHDPAAADLAEQMLMVADHHGDRTANWSDAMAYLAVRHRSAAAPLANCPAFVGVADVRLDNRQELTAELVGNDRGPPSDVELLLLGFLRWGEQLAHRLVGDFAFMIWSPEQRYLYVARDPFGTRPLYYSNSATRFAAASEVEQLLALEGTEDRLDDRAVLNYLTGAPCDPRQTLFAPIQRLLPGHWLRVTPERLVEERYWSPPFSVAVGRSPQESVEAFRHHFRNAVARRLVGDSPVIAQLSGGLDSSSIVCTANELLQPQKTGAPKVHVSSALYPGLSCDESVYIQPVLEQTGFPHEGWDGTAAAPVAQEQPCAGHPWAGHDPNTLEGDFRLARRLGAKAMLSGFGGDELLFEAGVFRELAQSGQWVTFIRQIWLGAHYSTRSRWSFLREALDPLVPMAWRQRLRDWRKVPADGPPAWLSHRLQQLWRDAPVGAPEAVKGLDGATAQQTWDWLTRPALSRAIELQVLRAARQGVELRYPFLDRTLAEFVLTLPVSHRLPEGRMKRLLRTAMTGILPPVIASRSQATTFNAVLVLLFEKNRASFHTFFTDGEWLAEPYVDRQTIFELFARLDHKSGKIAGPEKAEHVLNLLDALQLERWLHTLASRKRPSSPGVADEPRTRPFDAPHE